MESVSATAPVLEGPSGTVPAWHAYAQAVVELEVLRARVLLRGMPPKDAAGLYVDDSDVDRLLAEIAGIRGVPNAKGEAALATFSGKVQATARGLHGESLRESVFAALVRALDLTESETEVLALLCGVEVDPRLQALLIYVQDSVHLPRVTLATLDRLFGDGTGCGAIVGPETTLDGSGLVDVSGDGPWATRTAQPASRVIWALKGSTAPDPGLPPSARVVSLRPSGPRPVPRESGPRSRLFLTSAPDPLSRLEAAGSTLGTDAFLVTQPPRDELEWRAVVREGVVRGIPVAIEITDALDDRTRRLIEATPYVRWVLSSPRELPLEELPQVPWTEVPSPAAISAPETLLDQLGVTDAGGHHLTSSQLQLVSEAMRGTDGDLDAAVRRLASGHLDSLAVRVQPRRTWDDVVLPEEDLEQLHDLVSRYRHRCLVYEDWGFEATPSAGLVAVFAGPSGTGKTMAAEIVAGAIGLDVYKIDLSSVVSKYIGETEKNLERIFSAAAAGNVVLFFDEADALFGKRSSVGDAHDRYANIEVAYLLQRLETYDGLVILATNLQGNMDQAFLRRIHVSIAFPDPDEESRRRIWERSFPAEAPTADLNLDALARDYEVSGGIIRNAVVAAAFKAADADEVITDRFVAAALRRELRKLGRLPAG